jgi:cobalt-precorrin-5B (C1)-methyltransferase
MAQGVPHTHAAKSAMTMNRLAEWVLDLCGDRTLSKTVLNANTARYAFDLLQKPCPEAINHVGRQIVDAAQKFAGTNLMIRSVIFDYQGDIFYDSGLY